MKKLFPIVLLSLSCACTLAAASACKDNESPSGSGGGSSDKAYTVSFTAGEGFDYVLTGEHENADATSLDIAENETVSFTLDVGAFYAGNPTVLANNVTVASADGVYTLTVKANTTITVTGITKDVSNMTGTGAYDDAFLVTRPIDLIYIAEQVNAGNETYSTAAYVLGNDIDCKGEELKVIGDLSNDAAFFSGCFVSYSDPETGEMEERYTISNFEINATDTSYVGLFGCVQTNLTTTSSGLFYGICLDNYSINASTENMKDDDSKVLYCGSLIGYGIGVNAYLCDATNGELNVYADNNYFAFAGGLIGCQQALYEQSLNQIFTSEITYSTVDVDVTAISGTMLYAGGIAAYTFTNSLVAPTYIHNSYSTGSVSGGLRMGGIVGGLGQYTAVAACYATGDVLAQANTAVGGMTDAEYCVAYAGGIVGYAENDSSIADCFFTGDTLATAATSGAEYALSNDFVAGGDLAGKLGANAQKYVLFNQPSVDVATYTQADYEKIGFNDSDWVFANGELPLINYATSAATVETVYTVHYITKDAGVSITANGVSKTSFTLTNAYEPIVSAFNGGNLAVYLTGKAKKNNAELTGVSYRSYGYFFDEECTIPVPYSFLITRSVDLYVGFADYNKISGTYYLQTEKGAVPIRLTSGGMCEYTDGTVDVNARYLYDGKTLLIEGAPFSQYYMGAVDPDLSVNEDAAFDMNRYAYANVEGVINDDGSISFYDGVYFTKANPLTATKTATPLAPMPAPTTKFNAPWHSLENGATLTLDGGKATLVYADGLTYDLVVEQSMTDGYLCLYYVQKQSSNGDNFTYKTVFGYLTYNEQTHTIAATVLDPTSMDSSYVTLTMLYVDKFEGEWVSADNTFGNIYFNGWGYPYNYNGFSGYITVGDSTERTPYTLDENGNGTFTYDGYRFELRFDTLTGNAVIMQASGDEIVLERKDEFAKYTNFVAFNEETFDFEKGYHFDGKSYLAQGGLLTLPSGESVKYQNGDLFAANADLTQNPAPIGSIVKSDLYYVLNYGGKEYKLYPANQMMGTWAMSGQFDCLEIGPEDLHGDVYAKFKGKIVKMTYLDPATLTFSTKIQNMPVTYYLFLLTTQTGGETVVTGIAMSEYTSLAYNVYTICSKADDLYGTWTQAGGNGMITMSFDGVSFDPSGRYSYGQAHLSYDGNPTPYYYIFMDGGEVLMWSQATLTGKTKYYTLVDCAPTEKGAYVRTQNGETRAVKRVEVDSLFMSKATDDNGYTYVFDGGNVGDSQGTVTVSKSGTVSKTYSYKINEYKTNEIVLTFTDSENKTYTATIDTSVAGNAKIAVVAA